MKKIATIIGTVVAFGAAYALTSYMGLTGFVFVAAFIGGGYLSQWYIKRGRVSESLIKWVSWSNLLTWLLPPLGIFTSVTTWNLAEKSTTPKYRSRGKYLAITGAVLSLINATIGVLMNLPS